MSAGGSAPHSTSAPVSTLRGASVAVDGRRVGQIVMGLIMVALAVLGVVFIVVGINKNNQIDELKSQGVPVSFVVSKCLGLLGGSGSNGAGYSCQGTYTIDGRRFSEYLPGDSNYAPGVRVQAITVRSDPSLLSTPAVLNSERASASVFILPAVLLGVCALLVAAVLLHRRRARKDGQLGGV